MLKELRASVNITRLPNYSVFEAACRNGLSVVRPFRAECPRSTDEWNFCAGFAPSYLAFGRMRALLAVEDLCRLGKGRVLEVAAGDGALAATLTTCGFEVVVNDLRAEVLEASLQNFSNADKIPTCIGNIFDLKAAETGTFDYVVACDMIEHVAHPGKLLKHLLQFLEPQGRLVVTTPNGKYFRNRLPTFAQIRDFAVLEPNQFKPDADGHLFLFTPDELVQLARAVGLHLDSLCVWGTPALSGHGGLRHFASRHFTRTAYEAERWAQHLPPRLRQRFCVAMTAIFSKGAESAVRHTARPAMQRPSAVERSVHNPPLLGRYNRADDSVIPDWFEAAHRRELRRLLQWKP